jgi:hypothetical protein
MPATIEDATVLDDIAIALEGIRQGRDPA